MDSGAHSFFTVYNRGKLKSEWKKYYLEKEFQDYLETYIEFLVEHGNRFDMYVTMDIIHEPAPTLEILEYMESCGVKPLPVVHYGTDKKYLFRYLDKYEYFCLGGIGQNISITAYKHFGDYVYSQIYSKKAPTPELHGLAMTSIWAMKRWPWLSVDSKSWVASASYGYVTFPKGLLFNGEYDFLGYKQIAVSDRRLGKVKNNMHVHSSSSSHRDFYNRYIEWTGVDGSKLESSFEERLKINAITMLGVQEALNKYWQKKANVNGPKILFAGNPISEPAKERALLFAKNRLEKNTGKTINVHAFETFYHTKLTSPKFLRRTLKNLNIKYRKVILP